MDSKGLASLCLQLKKSNEIDRKRNIFFLFK